MNVQLKTAFEGFCVEEDQELYILELTLSKNMDVSDFYCQCAKSHGLCNHKAGLIWGVNLMLQMECSNLNEALKRYCEDNGLEYEIVE